ncbi:hypothetical protein L861_06270 [Litchfieldella anticariensis FP35 = DSM 16096]|uniref:Polymer-forming cytoskeletal protein n=2 Tax=Litchfieldella anticariensis TaxID=258591 RepID=S2KJI6_LITA3|nr:hypothetical protein L861_06270 [Halomonas anticariensis FP35 = DSM 16096]
MLLGMGGFFRMTQDTAALAITINDTQGIFTMFNKPKRTNASTDHLVSLPATDRQPHNHDEVSEAGNSARSIARIGPTACINGDIAGEENLLIEGQVNGTIEFKHNTITIGNEGDVQGDVFAHTLYVAGKVEGRLIASHKITIRHSAHITGTIISPCLVLEDGAVFHGNIDMDPDNRILADAFGSPEQPLSKTQSDVSESSLSGMSGEEETLSMADQAAQEKSLEDVS